MTASFGLSRSCGDGAASDDAAPAGRAASQQEQQQEQQQETMDCSRPWLAVVDGNLTLLQSSLQALNLPITAADDNGYTILQAAASYSHIPILHWLMEQQEQQQQQLDRSTMLNAVDNEGDSALHYASTKEAAEFLIQCGIDMNLRNAEGKTALESKQAEIEETMASRMEDGDDDEEEDEDEELVHLREVEAYLLSLNNRSQ